MDKKLNEAVAALRPQMVAALQRLVRRRSVEADPLPGKPFGEEVDACYAEALALCHELGFETCLISNNQKPRVEPFAKAMKTRYLYNAHKPSPKNYLLAMEKMGTGLTDTVFIGDQLFTDVWGAKKAGIYSILVKPIHPKEEIQIVLKRRLERIVLYFYKKSLKKTTI